MSNRTCEHKVNGRECGAAATYSSKSFTNGQHYDDGVEREVHNMYLCDAHKAEVEARAKRDGEKNYRVTFQAI